MDYEKLGMRVRNARKENGYTQIKLAEMTGYSVQHISHVETGNTKLSVELLVSLSNVLNVSIDSLLGDSLENKDYPEFVIELKVKSENEKKLICHVVNELQQGLKEL